jgi:catechol 2,3-dioxygenase-like lactoylglutathione lyase family enzyme
VKVSGLDHVQIAIPAGGEEAARQFYGELLGLREMDKPEPLTGRGGAWFAGPGIDIHLGVEKDFRPARKAHVAVLVTNLDTARATLTAAGVAVTDDEVDIGVERFYADDPFGNRLEFVSEADRGFTGHFTNQPTD